MDDRRTTILVAIVLLAGAASVVYCASLNSPFVFDDSGSVTDNPSIVRLWPLWGNAEHSGPLTPPADLPTSGRPLVNLSLAINYYFGELNPIGYHVFNLIVHVLSALLLMAIVWRTLRLDYFGGRFDRAAGSLALIVALLWTLHPLQTETVVYVTQRTELMVGFFYLATLYASFRYWAAASSAGRKVWLALATTACLAGMACKEVMVTAPVIVLLFERTFITGSFRRAMQKSWPLYVGLFLSWTLLLYLNYNAPRSDTAGFARASHIGLPAYAWWLTQTKVLLLYLKLAIWPWPLSIHYGTPYLQSLGAAWPWVAGVTVLAIATLVLLWRFSAVGFVGGWVLIILSPTLVVPIITEVAAERRMYLPLAAIMTLLVVGGYWLVQRLAPWPARVAGKRKSSLRWPEVLAGAAAFLVALVLGAVSVRRLAAYDDALTLWQDNVIHQPDDPLAHNNLGNALLSIGRNREAIEHYQQALQLKPNYTDARIDLGIALSQEGRYEEAIEIFQNVLQAEPGHPEVHCNLGVALAKCGKLEEAIKEYQKALRLKPDYFNAYYNLGNSLSAAGRPQEAIVQYLQALRLDPKDSRAHYNLGNEYQQTGQLDKAIQHFQAALRLRPNFPEAHNNLASALLHAGRAQEAVEHYQQAVQQRPDDADTYLNMAIAYASIHRSADAAAAAQKALELARSQGQSALVQKIETLLAAIRAK
jgi:protein O-mannosyl-transferase